MTRVLTFVAAAALALTVAVPVAVVAVLTAGVPAATACAPGGLAAAVVPDRYARLVDAAARRHELPAAVLAGLIRAESGWDPNARSSAGAVGLTQLMPATARGLGVTDRTDASQGIDGGARYLAAQLARFDDLRLALAAYNAGPAAVDRHGGVPPYAETRAYVKHVLAYARAYAGATPSLACQAPTDGEPSAWGGFDNGRIPPSALTAIGDGLHLRDDAARAFLAMSIAHARELGYPIGVTDAYRDYAVQVDLAGRKPSLAATPGRSHHGWGLAVDLVTGGWDGATMRWLETHAWRFGWVHPAWAQADGSIPEHWHWEFHGVPGT